MVIAMAVLIMDVLHLMMNLPKISDERENYHQLVIERNVSFVALMALLIIAIYQSFQHLGEPGLHIDYSILIVVGAMLAAKVISTFYVRSKM